MTTIDLVKQWSLASGVSIPENPKVDDADIRNARMGLLELKMLDLDEALYDQDKVAILRVLCELQYILDGTFLALGFAGVKDSAFAEVHRSNMTRPAIDGSAVGGAEYSPPSLEQFVQ